MEIFDINKFDTNGNNNEFEVLKEFAGDISIRDVSMIMSRALERNRELKDRLDSTRKPNSFLGGLWWGIKNFFKGSSDNRESIELMSDTIEEILKLMQFTIFVTLANGKQLSEMVKEIDEFLKNSRFSYDKKKLLNYLKSL